jgi:hypothetical protein
MPRVQCSLYLARFEMQRSSKNRSPDATQVLNRFRPARVNVAFGQELARLARVCLRSASSQLADLITTNWHFGCARKTSLRLRRRSDGRTRGWADGHYLIRPNRCSPTCVQALLAPSPWHHERWRFPANSSFPASSPIAALLQEDRRSGWCRQCRFGVSRSLRHC